MVESDVLGINEHPDEELKKKIATARAVLIQGLGDMPLWLCLSDKGNPYSI